MNEIPVIAREKNNYAKLHHKPKALLKLLYLTNQFEYEKTVSICQNKAIDVVA
jgi:hypothetical protein